MVDVTGSPSVVESTNWPHGNNAWSGTTDVASSNNVYATVTCPDNQGTAVMVIRGLGFSIPTSATITHVKGDVECKVSSTPVDYGMRFTLTKNAGSSFTSPMGLDAGISTSDQLLTTDWQPLATWGITLTPTEVNSSNFGGGGAALDGDGFTWSIDFLAIHVRYTEASGASKAHQYRLRRV